MGEKRTFVSKKKLTHVKCEYRKWNLWKEGDVVVGKFVAEREDKYKKPSWIIEVIEAHLQGKPKLAAKLKGQNLGLNSTGTLDKAMEQVEIGNTVQITYSGMEEMTGGPFKGKDRHVVEVDIVEEAGEEDEEVSDDEEEDEDDSDDL